MSSGARSRVSGGILVALGVIVCASTGIAQEPPDFATIRRTDFRSNIDRQRVQEWVKQQLDELFSAEKPLAAGALFYPRMLEHFKAADATTGFKEGLAGIVAEEFTARYKPEDANPARTGPIPVVFVLTLLKAYGQPTALPCFTLGLKDPVPGVRLTSAAGLLAARIGAQQWEALLADLQQAASKETDPITLNRLLRVITRDGGPAADQVVAALLRILDARFARFEQKGEFPATADAEAVTWLAGRFPRINDARTRSEIALRAARLLADTVHAYVNHNTTKARGQELERIIATTEKRLKEIAKPPGDQPLDITSAMFEDDRDTRAQRMTLELDRWIGTEATAGFLNGPPFNLKRGLDIKRAAPATKPAPSPAGE